ncbi:MAG: chitin deacetylase [Rhodospirillales bacterium]|nr:chitin deacetylase [Rhodospirillales bacterium]
MLLLAAMGGGLAHAEPNVAVVAYMRVGEDSYPTQSLRFDQFEAQLAQLRANAAAVVPLERIARAMRDGSALPEDAIAITIDEAYRSTLTDALPELMAAKLPVTIFATPDRLDRGGEFASWAELKALAARGVAIGARLPGSLGPEVDEAQLAADLNRTLSRMRDELGQMPTMLALPAGPIHPSLPKLLEARGLLAAFGQQSGPVFGGSDRWQLPRFAMTEAVGNSDRFRTAISSLPLPVHEIVPASGVLQPGVAIGFTVDDAVGTLDRLACFSPGSGRLTLERPAPTRVELRASEPFEPGLVRINCTLPVSENRWRWFGLILLVPS